MSGLDIRYLSVLDIKNNIIYENKDRELKYDEFKCAIIDMSYLNSHSIELQEILDKISEEYEENISYYIYIITNKTEFIPDVFYPPNILEVNNIINDTLFDISGCIFIYANDTWNCSKVVYSGYIRNRDMVIPEILDENFYHILEGLFNGSYNYELIISNTDEDYEELISQDFMVNTFLI